MGKQNRLSSDAMILCAVVCAAAAEKKTQRSCLYATRTCYGLQVELALGMLFGDDSKGVAGLERASKAALNR